MNGSQKSSEEFGEDISAATTLLVGKRDIAAGF